MYIELSALNNSLNKEEIRQHIFSAASLHLDGVCVFPSYVAYAKEFTIEGLHISTTIDYPSGLSNTSTRNHAVLTSIRNGAKNVDLTLNHSYIINNQIDKLVKDIATNLAICQDNNVFLRAILEYKLFDNTDLLLDTISLLKELGVPKIIPSSGSILDSFLDNLIIAKIASSKIGIDSITNGGIVSKDQYELVKESKIYGLRVNSIQVAERLFGV